MVFIKSKKAGIKIPRFNLVFGEEAIEVSDEIAEKLLEDEGRFELLEGSELKTKEVKKKKKLKEVD